MAYITVTTITARTVNLMFIEDVKKIDNDKYSYTVVHKFILLCGATNKTYFTSFWYNMWFLNSAGNMLQYLQIAYVWKEIKTC